jgi:hypothetical protein
MYQYIIGKAVTIAVLPGKNTTKAGKLNAAIFYSRAIFILTYQPFNQ